MHMLRADAPNFEGFGEVYFSWIFPGVVKGWHLHDRMRVNYAVPVGHIKVVLYDDRSASPTRGSLMEVFTGPDDYKLISIPPLVWNGFKAVGDEPALVVNCATLPHDPNEITRLDPSSERIPYKWDVRHG